MVCERKKPLTCPATAGESAVAGHPKGEGYISDLDTRGVQRKMWYVFSLLGGEERKSKLEALAVQGVAERSGFDI
jgi:hypothetical protein